jgi:outer membrane receptor protein involved in Fe transport
MFMKMKGKFLQIFVLCIVACLPFFTVAQVTNSSISGTVTDATKKELEGASIVAIHTPSGTSYESRALGGGNFVLSGLRSGGPYKVTVTFAGFEPAVFENINLQLGETFDLQVTMTTASNELGVVTVTSSKRKLPVDKTGAATNISSRQLTTLPTISRSITDFTRVTPQANGNSFAGRDGRYNNLQIDGANLNNNFGLSTDPLPGGGNQPISLDAIEEVSVNIAPYDVRQSGFTGAGINAITKSGSNTFKGSVYGYYRDQSFNGARVANNKLPAAQEQENRIFGATLGGPIIKNKLFFFISAETEKSSRPGVTLLPSGIGATGDNVSNTHIDSLNKLSEFVRTRYGYETGSAESFRNFNVENRKLLGRIDWNINKVHKLTLKYSNLTVLRDDQALNGSSVPNNPSFRPAGSSGTISRLPNNRFSRNSMAFDNSNYGFERTVSSGSLELNSRFNSKLSNQFLATVTKIQDVRTLPGGLFPTVDIFNNNGANYMHVGADPFTANNEVINDVVNIVNNLTYYAGKHTITGGVNYEYQRVGNMFMPGAASYYAYNSLDDFINDRTPAVFSLTYALDPNKSSVFAADLKIAQLGIYLQDEFSVNNRFKLTYGIRVDKPIYIDQPVENPAFSALRFADKDGNSVSYSTGTFPKNKALFSPRVGFRWDVEGDKSMIIRGGTGLFTGRVPFVWLTNIPQNSFMLQAAGTITSTTDLATVRFNPDPNAYRNRFPSTAGQTILNNANFVVADPNFKFPQVIRTNIAVDKSLGNGFALTLEAIYSKDINAVVMRNANEAPTNATLNNSGDNRVRFNPNNNTARRINPNVASAIVLENTNKGYQASITAELKKAFTNGFYGTVAYTYSLAADVTANPGSQATSVWNSNPAVGTSNSVELMRSQYAIPHRIVANFSYRKEYLRNLATTIGIFYDASPQGLFSFTYNGDINGDGNNTTDLMWIPENPTNINFVPITSGGNVVHTVAAQQAAWAQYVSNTNYINDKGGSYAERNGGQLPWYHRVDLKFLQDVFVNIGKNKNTFQLSVDVLNFANLLNRDWGVRQSVVANGRPLILNGVDANGVPSYRLEQLSGQLITRPFQQVVSTSSTWGMQLGLRYIFN